MAHTRVHDFVIAGSGVEGVIDRLRPGALVVVAGERSDIVLASGLVYLQGMPLAGLLLTFGSKLTPQVATLMGGPGLSGLPILITEQDTYATAARLGNLSHDVRADDTERMEQALTHATEHIDTTALLTLIGRVGRLRMPPPAFRHRMVQAARAANKRIVLPEGDEPRTLRAAALCHLKGIARCVLLGEPDRIRHIAETQGVVLPDQVEIIDPAAVRGRYIEPMTALRRAKGVTALQAEQQLEDNVVFGTMMLALRRGRRTGFRRCAYNRQYDQAGAAIDPDRARRDHGIERVLHVDAERGAGLRRLCRQSGPDSRGTGRHRRAVGRLGACVRHRTACCHDFLFHRDLRQRRRRRQGRAGAGAGPRQAPDLLIDGPLQYDAASVESVGRQKAPDSPVAGRADGVRFPRSQYGQHHLQGGTAVGTRG